MPTRCPVLWVVGDPATGRGAPAGHSRRAGGLVGRAQSCGGGPAGRLAGRRAVALPEQLGSNIRVIHLYLGDHVAGHQTATTTCLAHVETIKILVTKDLQQNKKT